MAVLTQKLLQYTKCFTVVFKQSSVSEHLAQLNSGTFGVSTVN